MTEEQRDRSRAALREKAQALPNSPGIYMFRDARGDIVYVGKAKSLKKRVASYMREDLQFKTKHLMQRARDLAFIVTESEKDALLLENSLIKEHRPKYNINLRDDKDYPCLRITINEDYPRLEFVRRPKKDGALYFGPFSSAGAVRQTMKLMQRLFPLRKCSGKIGESKRPCLNYQMGRCLGPCWSGIGKEEYDRVVQEAIYFLQGKRKELERLLTQEMEKAAAEYNFERAAAFRDRLKAIRATLEKQHVIYRTVKDVDVIGVHRGDNAAEVAMIMVRAGSIRGSRSFVFDVEIAAREDFLSEFIRRYYDQSHFIPPEILTPEPIPDKPVIEEWLSGMRGLTVKVVTPQRGAKRDLVKMAQKNALNFQKARLSKEKQTLEVLNAIREALALKEIPRSIECYDISTTMGKQNVGSRVSFYMGEPNKMGYRRYKVEGEGHPDDYAMMREVFSRRLEKTGQEPLPDLVVVDGGKGQLNVALRVAQEYGLQLEIVGLAKEGFDKVFLPGRKNPVIFRPDSKALHLLQRIRDESHRFAIQYHRKLRTKAGLETELENIPGVGPQRRKALLKHFGSVEQLRNASAQEIEEVRGVNSNLAALIYEFFQTKNRA